MILRALGWGYKSKLVFLDKLPGRRGICSKAHYLQQALQPVIFSLLNSLGSEYIFIKDGAKVYVTVVMSQLPPDYVNIHC